MSESKTELRVRARLNRSSVTVDSARICSSISRFLATIGPGWIVLFSALPREPDLSALMDLQPDRRFALTRTPDLGKTLSVHPASSALELHRFGFMQPVDGSPVVPSSDIAAVMVPGLAFDRYGGRLGFGAGYYDRFLASLSPDVLRIGVTDGFIVERIPTEDHDVAMTHLAGEFGVVKLPMKAVPE